MHGRSWTEIRRRPIFTAGTMSEIYINRSSTILNGCIQAKRQSFGYLVVVRTKAPARSNFRTSNEPMTRQVLKLYCSKDVWKFNFRRSGQLQKWAEQSKKRQEEVEKRRETLCFPMFCGPGQSTSKLAKAAGAEPFQEMRD